MTLQAVRKILWSKAGAADLRALLGKHTGHEVLAWGPPSLWQQFGVDVATEGAGGTEVPVADGDPLRTYWASPARNEVRVKVPPLLHAEAPIVTVANMNSAAIDPDGAPTEQFMAFLIRTDDGVFLRGTPKSRVPEGLRQSIAGDTKGFLAYPSGLLIDELEGQVLESLLQHKNVLLYGPAGTGKTRLMLRIKAAFDKGLASVAFDPEDLERPLQLRDYSLDIPANRKSQFVTFHPSLTYENFVVGLRPDPDGGGLKFKVEDGVFLRLAQHAEFADSASLLLIDEFNRANVADVLGELITLLEDDKRALPDGALGPTTVTVTLPIKPDKGKQDFVMPHHFYLLASMNPLDRSVAPIDSALRRRFRMVHVKPDVGVLKKALLEDRRVLETVVDPANPTPDEVGSLAVGIMRRVNEHIMSFWGPEFLIGQAYLLKVADARQLIMTVKELMIPLLADLYREQPAALERLLGTSDAVGTDALVTRAAPASSQAVGLMNAPGLVIRDLSVDDVAGSIRGLHWLAFGTSSEQTPVADDVPEEADDEEAEES